MLVPFYIVGDLFGGDLAVISGEGDDLVAGGFNGAGFMAVDVAGNGGQYALPGTQDRCDYSGIGLGAAYQKMYIGVRRMTRRLDLLPGRSTDLILAVANGLHHVGFHQALHNRTMRAFQIITVKVDHRNTPFFKSFSDTILSHSFC